MSFKDSSTNLLLTETVKSSKSNRYLIDKVSSQINIDGVQISEPQNIFSYQDGEIKQNMISIVFESRYAYRPELVASELFGSTDLWYLILEWNNCKSHKDFVNFRNIVVLNPDRTEILKNLLKTYKNTTKMNTVRNISEDKFILTPLKI